MGFGGIAESRPRALSACTGQLGEVTASGEPRRVALQRSTRREEDISRRKLHIGASFLHCNTAGAVSGSVQVVVRRFDFELT